VGDAIMGAGLQIFIKPWVPMPRATFLTYSKLGYNNSLRGFEWLSSISVSKVITKKLQIN